jgi:uncharacterized membrane protein YoaK (UPF0700 family)
MKVGAQAMLNVEIPRMRQMSRIGPPLLSFVAGYVDSCTFLALFGLFVAQVTGSFVIAGTQLVVLKPGVLLRFAEIFAFFLAAVAITIIVRSAERRGRNAWTSALALEGLLLSGLLILWIMNGPWEPDTPIVLFASLLGLSAMGVQSAFVMLLMQGSPSTNVMTSNTTRFAIDTAELVLARWRRRRVLTNATAAAENAEIERRLRRLWPVLLSFFFGTLAGAAAYAWLNLWCVLVAIAIIGVLLVWAQRFRQSGHLE